MIRRSALIKKYLYKYRYRLSFGSAFVVLTNLFVLLIPRTFKHAIDAINVGDQALLLQSIELIAVYALLGGLSRFVMRNNLFTAGRFIEQDIRNDFFARLLVLPQAVYQQMKTGDLLSRALNDMDSLRYLFGHVTMHVVNIISLYIFAIISLATLNKTLTLLAILPFPLLFLITRYYSKMFFSQYREVMEKMAGITVSLQEIFSSMTVIKAYAREVQVRDRFEKANNDYVNSNLKLVKTGSIYHPFITLFTSCSALIILWIGGLQVIRGNMTLGAFVAFNGTLVFLIQPTVFIGWVVNLYQRSRASVARIEDVLQHPGLIQDAPHVDLTITGLSGRIDIRHLTFAYLPELPVLKDISLQIEPGQLVSLIGEVGCGKSTLLQVLQRIYPAPDQSIYFDNHELTTIPLKTLYQESAYVSQEPIIFSGTIKENIAYFNPAVAQEKIMAAAQFAALEKDILSFDKGYDTLVGEHGITLSGGQKQRLAIARAIIKQPKILFIDNALSSVDTETEDQIFQNLLTLKNKITTLIVAHRMSTLKHCDTIILMDQGAIVAQGTHDDLLIKNEMYKNIYDQQNL